MADDRVQRGEAALLSALEAGDTDTAALIRDDLKNLRAGSNPSLTQEEARTANVETLKTGVKGLGKFAVQVGADAVKGINSLVTLPADAASWISSTLNHEPTKGLRFTSSLNDLVDQVVEPPRGPREQTPVSLASALATGLIGKGPALARLAGSVGSAAGGEAGRLAGQALEKDSGGHNAGIIGGLLGAVAGGVPAAALRSHGSANEIIGNAFKGQTSADFAEARRLAGEGQGAGVKLFLDQLFPNSAGLSSLVNATRAHGGSAELQKTILDQPHQVAAALRNSANQFGPRVGAEATMRDLRLASEGFLDDFGKSSARSALFEGSPGQRVDGAALGALQDRLSALETQFRADPDVVRQLQDVRGILSSVTDKVTIPAGTKPVLGPGTGSAKWAMKQEPQTATLNLGAEVSDLDTIHKKAKAALEQIKLDTPATSRLVTGKVATGLDELKQLLDEAIPTRALGRELHQSMLERANANSSGLIGRLAGRSGVVESRPDPIGMLRSTIGTADAPALAKLTASLRSRVNASTLAGATEDAAQANRAYPQAARTLFEDAIDRAYTSSSGRAPADAGSKFYASVFGSPGSGKSQAFEQSLQGVAAAFGKDPGDLTEGFKALARVVEASGRNRSQDVPQVIKGIGESTGRDLLRAMGVLALPTMLGEKLKAAVTEKQFRQIASVLTDPAALDIVERIGRTPVVSSRRQALIQSFFQVAQQPGRAVAEESKNGP